MGRRKRLETIWTYKSVKKKKKKKQIKKFKKKVSIGKKKPI